MDLLLQIEEIIENNGSDFELSKLFKQYIKEYKESLPKLFEKNQGKDFLVKHTKKLDSIISLMYKTVLRRAFGHYLPMRGSIPIAIIALGSYGREQLCVHSDIDLLIVYEDIEGFNTRLIIEKLFYLALDAGLKLGHRVHQANDLFAASNEDITIKTSLMESRLITGSSFTWQSTQKELNKIRIFEQKEFIVAKIQEAQIRRQKHPFSMQPNIKESVGGLRDSQLIFWIAHTLYGVTSLKDLTQVLFSEEEYREYRIALELLFRIRSALHLISNKQEDKLLLEHIPQVSAMLGFKDHRKMAQKVLEALWRINNFTQIFVKKMVRSTLFEKENISLLRQGRIRHGIFLLENRLYASYSLNTLAINNLLEFLVSLKDLPYKFDAGFLRLFTYCEIPSPLPVKTYALIKDLLSRDHVFTFLKLFYDAGILHKLFTNFRNVLHLPQFDGYHHYPVDIHSIECVKALENIKEPFIKELYTSLNKEEKVLLKLVVLLHDTGKGRKQDHSELGAKTILPFTKKLKFSPELLARASLLVRHHILMSNVAFKENIHSEKILYKFMSNIEDSKNLHLLYILTYADINGVGGDTYNSFSSKLLYELYQSALEVSVNNDRITEAKKRINIEKKVRNHPDFASLPRLLQTKLIRVESNLFFFMHTPADIIRIALKAKETKEYSYEITTQRALSIEIYRKIPLNISYLLATLSYLDVGSMEVVTLFDQTKYFKIEFLKNIEEIEKEKISTIIEQAFDMQQKVSLNEIKIHKEEITVDCEHSLTLAQLSVHTSNQRGLLAYIMDKLEQLNINLVSAKVHSTKYKVRDTFLMQKQNELCNNVENIYKLLTQ